MKTNEVDSFAFPVLGNFQQVEDPEKTGFTRQDGSDIGKANRLDGIYLYLAILYSISCTYAHALVGPESNGTCDLSLADAIANSLAEHHADRPKASALTLFCRPTRYVPDMPGRVHDSPYAIAPRLVFRWKQNAGTSLDGILHRAVGSDRYR